MIRASLSMLDIQPCQLVCVNVAEKLQSCFGEAALLSVSVV